MKLPQYAFYIELLVQCDLAESSFSRLEEYAIAQIQGSSQASNNRPKNSLEVIADCTLFLSSTAMITKFLFHHENSPNEVKIRSTFLCTSLGITKSAYPNITSKKVRNSFEHADKRLDSFMKEVGNSDLCTIDISKYPSEHTHILKRFNPNNLNISFLGESVDTRSCINEVNIIKEKILSVM